MKRFILLLSIMAVFFCCNQNPGTEASSVVPSVNKNLKQDSDFKIYSEAASRKITIGFESKETGQAMLSVYYSDGKLLDRKTLFVNKGMNTWDYKFTYRASGVFIIKFLMNRIERAGKVFKTS